MEEKTYGSCLYFLKSGSCQVIVNGKTISEFKSPAIFGEKALMSDLYRVNSIKSSEICYLYVLEKDKFLKLFNNTRKELGHEERKEIIENSSILSKILLINIL